MTIYEVIIKTRKLINKGISIGKIFLFPLPNAYNA